VLRRARPACAEQTASASQGMPARVAARRAAPAPEPAAKVPVVSQQLELAL